MITIGFDPGGKDKFGWAALCSEGDTPQIVASGTCDDARSAVDAVKAAIQSEPAAIGVDAPLSWAYSGDRKADAAVRKLVAAKHGQSATVIHVNSLRGACLVQGILVARLARDLWPNAQVTEAHPKAQLKVCMRTQKFVTSIAASLRRGTEDERDAAIAAYAALALAKRTVGWRNLVDDEPDAFFPTGAPVSYWFPESD